MVGLINMTKLSAVPEHLIWIECRCGHHKSVSVADLLESLPDTTTVDQVTSAARCSACGQRGDVKSMRIVFKGGM
jgi:transcription elongation factor Elf1